MTHILQTTTKNTAALISKIKIRSTSPTRKNRPTPGKSPKWCEPLGECGRTIAELARSIEKDFLEIGGKLQDYTLNSRQISDLTTQIREIMTGSEITGGIEGLSLILESLQQHLTSLEGQFDKRSDILSHYLDVIGRVVSSLEEFRMLVLNLNMLGFFTQVENAHISSTDTGFASLANDVKTLGLSIEGKTKNIITESEQLAILIRHTFSDVMQLEKNRQAESRNILTNTITNQESLAGKHDQATDAARNLASRSEKISASIGEIVSAVQFNDITRQQLEHVTEALDNLCDILINDPEHANLSEDGKAAMVMDMCRLQSAQLKQSRNKITDAVDDIIKNMREISSSVSHMLSDTQQIAWASDIDGLAFMEEIDSGIGSVVNGLTNTSREQLEMEKTMQSVSATVENMSGFVMDIERLGQELQLIALNARIKAAHIGLEGAALDTISGSIYELSKNSRHDTRAISEILTDVVNTAQQFASRSDSGISQQEQVAMEMSEKLKQFLESLHATGDQVLGVLSEVSMLGNRLANQISDTADSIDFHLELNARITDEIKNLDDIAGKAQDICGTRSSSHDSQYIAQLKQRYTMQSEREIHQEQLKEDNTHETAASENDESEFGDNVDLF